MTVQEANKYGEILNELDGLQGELTQLIEKQNFASSILNGFQTNSVLEHSTLKSIDKIEQVKERICYKIQELIEEYEKLDKKIENINNPIDKQIIRLRHINRLSFEEIGDTLFYNGGTIKNRYYKIFRESSKTA